MSDEQTVGMEAGPAESTGESAESAESIGESAETVETAESAETAKSVESIGESAESTAEPAPTGRGSGEGTRQVLDDRIRRDAVKLVKSANRDADARRRRMQSLAGGLAGLAVVILVVVGYVVLKGGTHDTGGQAAAAASAPAADGSTADAGAAGAPSLPPGADPALGQEPAVSAGTGDLSKLVVKTLIQGTGPAVKAGQNITVNYIGVTYKDGQKFDASWDRGQPATFPIGVGSVIPGWDQGLVGVKVGSRVQLDIPAKLAYGDHPANGAPGGPLRFVVDLLAAQ